MKQDYEDRHTSTNKALRDELIAAHNAMPRRWCSVHNREECKYESLEHELGAERCRVCGEPKPHVPGVPSPPPYYCLKHREHVEGKGCLDQACPVCHPNALTLNEDGGQKLELEAE